MASTRPTRRSRRAALAVSATLVTTIGTALGATALPASATPSGPPTPAQPVAAAPTSTLHHLAAAAGGAKLAGDLANAHGAREVFVQLAGPGAADAAMRAVPGDARAAARARRAGVARIAQSVLGTALGKDRNAVALFHVANAVPGVGVRADAAALKAIAARRDVVKVSPLPVHKVSNASAAQLTRVLETWQSTHDLGKGVRVGVIDTGLDFTHADFGGPGTVKAYNTALAHDTDPAWRSGLPALAKAKVAGGWDFVGANYNADPSADNYQPTPHPDPDPLDCAGHGTHVAGTVAGYGENGSGKTFTGNYAALNRSKLYSMKIGPGMAPAAKLYALKVFGCGETSTDEVIPALDWALDPNGDGDYSDHLDIVNLSLGGDFAPADDPENAVVDELAKHGVLPVIAMGNAGDVTDAGGAPGNAVRSLAVASSVDELEPLDGLKINAPASDAGVAAGQVSVAYDWSNHKPVTGSVVALSGANADGCDPLSAGDAAKVKGKVAWLEWDDNDSTRRCGSVKRSANVVAAGATGALFSSTLDQFSAGITGSDTIPVFQLTGSETSRLRPAVQAGTLNVTFDGSLIATIKKITPANSDTLSDFTSRGPHGSLGVVKPDVTAPGSTIASAHYGSGSGAVSFSGTSMATPHTAGIAALVKAAHPGWGPTFLKAAIMNTAGHDLFTKPGRTGLKYGPNRVGAGRVDAAYATSTKLLAYATDKPGAVSASFGVVYAPITSASLTRKIPVRVRNLGGRASRVQLSYQPVVSSPGVTYSVSPSAVTVPAHNARMATVTMTVRPSALRHTIDPTMEKTQLGVARQFVSDASGRVLVKPANLPALRVPVYGAAKPTSATTASVGDGQIVMSGRGVDQGTQDERYRSLVSVMQLGATSGDAPVCLRDPADGCVYSTSSRAGDLKYVGAGSNADYLWFGIATQHDWATVGNTLVPVVTIDTDGDGTPNYEIDVSNYQDTAGSYDLPLATTYDLNNTADPSDDKVVDQEPVNFEFGDVDTNVFDSNVLLIPVAKQFLPDAPTTGGASYPIKYQVATYDLNSGSVTDSTDPIAYDAGTPDVATDGPLFSDQGNTTIDYHLHGTAATTGGKALVIHLHGAPGKRAQVLDLPGSGQ